MLYTICIRNFGLFVPLSLVANGTHYSLYYLSFVHSIPQTLIVPVDIVTNLCRLIRVGSLTKWAGWSDEMLVPWSADEFRTPKMFSDSYICVISGPGFLQYFPFLYAFCCISISEPSKQRSCSRTPPRDETSMILFTTTVRRHGLSFSSVVFFVQMLTCMKYRYPPRFARS